MLSLGVLHTFHYELHKKAGMFFLILMYPRPRRAKNGVFSKPGRLHTRRTHHIDPKDTFDRRFKSAGKLRQDKKGRLTPYRSPK